QDFHPRHTRDIADYIGELDIHLAQRLLHTVERLSLITNFIGALADYRSHGTEGVRRPEGTAQEPVAHQLPNPLTIEHVRFTARYLTGGARIDQVNIDSAGIQNLEQGNPVNPGRLH